MLPVSVISIQREGRFNMGKWTRRAFITTGVVAGGGLAIGVALRPGHRTPELAPLVSSDDETLVNVWVKLDSKNIATVIVPHSEMGQGAQTALAQMLAEEMDADWDLVQFEEAPPVPEYANYLLGYGIIGEVPKVLVPTFDGLMIKVAQSMAMQITGGSLSIRSTGQYGMRIAGAAAREMLVEAAAQTWQVPAAEIQTEASQLIHAASNRRAPYAEFAAVAAQMQPPSSPSLKSADEFRIIGHHVQRRDIPAKVDGSAQFAMDVHVPGMVYATVQRAPVFGGGVDKLDASAAKQVKGVIDVVTLPGSNKEDPFSGRQNIGETVAVVAEGYWPAKQGLNALAVEWNHYGRDSMGSDEIFAQFDRDITAGVERENDRLQGDVGTALENAAQVVEAEYRVPYLAHACMEPMNATAHVQNGRCELWIGCQNPLGFRDAVAEALGMEPGNVKVHNHFMGGGFGRKANPDYAIQAALLAQKVERPVQLIWSREEDIRQDYYRPAVRSRFRAAIDANGEIASWENTYVDKHEPAEAPLIPYAVGSQDIGYVASPTNIPFGAWRSVDHTQHGFFTESFIDELAAAKEVDPYEFRANLLRDKPRHLAVLNKAAKEAGWEQPLAPGRGRGIALQESFGTLVAEVVEVTVTDGDVKVDRVVAAVDPGLAISPDGLKAQIESGIIYGLSAAMFGEVTIENGAVAQSNFHDYQILRMQDSPVIETHVINSGGPVGGAGEPGTPAIAPALANAVFDATGSRVRQLPLKNYDLKFRIEESDEVA